MTPPTSRCAEGLGCGLVFAAGWSPPTLGLLGQPDRRARSPSSDGDLSTTACGARTCAGRAARVAAAGGRSSPVLRRAGGTPAEGHLRSRPMSPRACTRLRGGSDRRIPEAHQRSPGEQRRRRSSRRACRLSAQAHGRWRRRPAGPYCYCPVRNLERRRLAPPKSTARPPTGFPRAPSCVA